MRKLIPILVLIMLSLSSCKLLGIGKNASPNNGKQEGGCPSNGKNVGAEKLLSDDKAAVKAPKYTKSKQLIY
ncbi:MAG: hypothetical protein ACRC0I_04050 [Sediminibacterium sp.]|jgi:hypothetical protein|nr:hypothetical protein [Chitinophagaceae bacterium]MCA6446921.1 hypothetical protein [Chitinophagaceae bacterium]